MLYAAFDFALLDDPEFKEDAVREELIAPLLATLGYSASGTAKIIRSKSLTHPFVHIGTKRFEIKIIPDYLLVIDNDHRWILDAKGPRENIRKGSNVEQAFSYAIHPDVRAFKYALCNGRELVVFDVRKAAPVLVVPLREVPERIGEVRRVLSPVAFVKPHLLNYRPDFGLYMAKLGVTEKVIQHFVPVKLPLIGKVEDGLYTASVDIVLGEDVYHISLDFDGRRYEELLNALTPEMASEIRDALRRQPFRLLLADRAVSVCAEARLEDSVHSNEDEDFCPLRVERFTKF